MRRLKAPDPQIFLFRWLTFDERRYAKPGLNQAVNLVRPNRICTRDCVMDQGLQQPAEELLNAKQPPLLRQMLAAASLISKFQPETYGTSSG